MVIDEDNLINFAVGEVGKKSLSECGGLGIVGMIGKMGVVTYWFEAKTTDGIGHLATYGIDIDIGRLEAVFVQAGHDATEL